MPLHTFRGGIHPPDRKILSEDCSHEVMPPPLRAVVFLSQHIGRDAQSVLEPGQEVKTGELIAKHSGVISAPIHSPVTGKLLEITKVFHPVHQKPMEAWVIERTSEDVIDQMEPMNAFDQFPKEVLYQRILEAGIVGMGGAAFPAHAKYIEAMKKPIEYLMINAAECEPYLTTDYRMMLEFPHEIIQGIRILLRVLGAKKALIGVEDNKPKAIEEMKKATNSDPSIEVKVLRTKYPQGAEKQLIKALLNREVPVGSFPFSVGAIVHNVATCIAIARAVVDGTPLYERGMTFTGEGVNTPKNLIVRIGTPIQDVIDFAGGWKGELSKVIMGGPMMGIALPSTEIPVMKGTSGILLLEPSQKSPLAEQSCINCGYCIHACPMGLLPNELAKLAKNRKYDQAVELGLMNCCECGSCAYQCPSKIEHVKHFKLAKKVYQTLKGGK